MAVLVKDPTTSLDADATAGRRNAALQSMERRGRVCFVRAAGGSALTCRQPTVDRRLGFFLASQEKAPLRDIELLTT